MICCSYNSNVIFASNNLGHITRGIITYSEKYEKTLLIGHFNIFVIREANMAVFCNEYKLKPLNKKLAWFKSYMSASCIDLYLTHFYKTLESTLTIETCRSDFHKLIITIVLKIKHEKVPPKVIQHRLQKF